MESVTDLSGEWSGCFRYLDDDQCETPFLMRLTMNSDAGAPRWAQSFAGDCSEPNLDGFLADYLYAFIEGSIASDTVTFQKTYDGSAYFAHSVLYVGTLSGDGLRIEGRWVIESLQGSFFMERTATEMAFEEEAKSEHVLGDRQLTY
ncbi:MAG: hypothetical protein AAF199_00735 [Pseudomonadota bacterium]